MVFCFVISVDKIISCVIIKIILTADAFVYHISVIGSFYVTENRLTGIIVVARHPNVWNCMYVYVCMFPTHVQKKIGTSPLNTVERQNGAGDRGFYSHYW